MKLRVYRPRFPFQGKTLKRGDIIETDDFDLPAAKWEQLRSPGSGHYFDEADPPGRSSRDVASSRQVREQENARQAFGERGDEKLINSSPATVACGACNFVAKSPHGLLVHSGRKHRAS